MDIQEQNKLLFKRIEQHRAYRGLNKRELAQAADITPVYYSELLTGSKTASIAIIYRLLDAVGCEFVLCLKENFTNNNIKA